MYIFKQPRIGGAVTPHQDGAFLYTVSQNGAPKYQNIPCQLPTPPSPNFPVMTNRSVYGFLFEKTTYAIKEVFIYSSIPLHGMPW